ncbi:hypothetical protein DIPPA_07124 [Diplonema papillatum]|nr:hypothetical protein DIPPA_07124 [Diplonema papillatum]
MNIDQEYWRNMVSHAFFHPDAFKPPHVVVTSSHTGTQLHLNKDYVSAFVSQWPKQHYLRIILRGITTEGRREILRTFNVSPHFWAHVKSSLNELLGQRAVQQLLYPHSRDAQRENNVLVSCEQIVPAEDDIACNDEDWAHAVSAWEVEVGFAFAKGSLPVPLMPPFRLDDEDGVLPHDAKIADYLSSELSVTGDTASSVSFQYDTDFIRNLSYHSRLMQHAREPPLFIVEDTNISHPIMVNQRFLVQYVKAWSRTHPHIVWVHNADNCTLVAKCRVTSEYWRYCVTTAPSLMASMGDGNVLAAGDSCRLGTHFLTVTSSCSAESLHMWDAVWFALVAEWETSLPKVGPQWSPTKQLPSPSVSIKWSLPGNTVSPPPPPLSLLDKRSAVASFDL